MHSQLWTAVAWMLQVHHHTDYDTICQAWPDNINSVVLTSDAGHTCCNTQAHVTMCVACSACIHELVEGGASGEVPCPLCRAPLQSKDLYDAVSEEEAEEARQAASIQGDYGSKVCFHPHQGFVVPLADLPHILRALLTCF